MNGLYEKCFSDTLFTARPDTIISWPGTVIKLFSDTGFIYTNNISCIDCTSRGTNIKPVFWDDDK
jgi:hypothetical protein